MKQVFRILADKTFVFIMFDIVTKSHKVKFTARFSQKQKNIRVVKSCEISLLVLNLHKNRKKQNYINVMSLRSGFWFPKSLFQNLLGYTSRTDEKLSKTSVYRPLKLKS